MGHYLRLNYIVYWRVNNRSSRSSSWGFVCYCCYIWQNRTSSSLSMKSVSGSILRSLGGGSMLWVLMIVTEELSVSSNCDIR